MPERYRPILAALLLMVLAAPLQGLGETPEEVQQRLELYRQRDAEAAREKARQEAEAVLRREQTRQWQERRRLEEYARRWKPYGCWEVDVLSWRQQKDGTWVTEFKEAPTPLETAEVRFGDTLAKIANRYNLTIRELLSLNPGLEAARLVVGMTIQLPRSTPCSSLPILSPTPIQGALIGVSCTSLMVNRNFTGQDWGSWMRPEEGSYDEKLVVDRCAAVKP